MRNPLRMPIKNSATSEVKKKKLKELQVSLHKSFIAVHPKRSAMPSHFFLLWCSTSRNIKQDNPAHLEPII